MRVLRPESEPEIVRYEFEANQTYVAEVEEFVASVQNRVTASHCLAEAELTLRVALSALKSAAEQKWVRFE